MKNILVSTDFSPNAYGATLYAAELARQRSARLILFHAYLPASFQEEAEETDTENDDLERQLQTKMDELTAELYKLYGVSITRLLKPGIADDEIPIVAQKVKADLIIVGNWEIEYTISYLQK